MIKSFKSADTEKLFNNKFVKKYSGILKQAQRKLKVLNAAVDLNDLKSPPGNRLEALIGNRKGQHSIRINDQWRICFVWNNGLVSEVEIVDYHK